MNTTYFNNDYIPSPENEPTCQDMFDDYIPLYLSIVKPIPKYQILHKEKLYDIFIISNIGTNKLYDTRLLENIPYDYITCEFLYTDKDSYNIKFITINKNDLKLK